MLRPYRADVQKSKPNSFLTGSQFIPSFFPVALPGAGEFMAVMQVLGFPPNNFPFRFYFFP